MDNHVLIGAFYVVPDGATTVVVPTYKTRPTFRRAPIAAAWAQDAMRLANLAMKNQDMAREAAEATPFPVSVPGDTVDTLLLLLGTARWRSY